MSASPDLRCAINFFSFRKEFNEKHRNSHSKISKINRERSEAFANTERVSLVSSFACSLFLGRVAPADWSDASGMSLLDIRRKRWSEQCLAATGAPGLGRRLGEPVPSDTVLGPASEYMRERFGLPEEAKWGDTV